jgi:nitrite reductase/ring-hydroxylating ferredoxin subunit
MPARVRVGSAADVADGQVVCPWHNSRFDLASGENLDWAPGFAGRDMPRGVGAQQ